MKVKKIIFLLLLVMILFPAFQRIIPLFDVDPLIGAYLVEKEPEFTSDLWLDAKYQANFENYLEQHIGFRPLFVKLYNQIQYSFYDKTSAFQVVVGKNNFVYQYEFIRSYYGKNFCGYEVIDNATKGLRIVSEQLKEKNIDLIIVLAPSKVAVYPENIPDKYKSGKENNLNHKYYKEKLLEMNLLVVDFYDYFVNMKNKLPYPLFSAQGMHWSAYGAAIASDSLVRYIENLRKVKLVNYELELNESYECISTDNDLENAMNLLWEIPNIKMAHPVIKPKQADSTGRCSILAVGDSFFYTMVDCGIIPHVFPDWHYWYYGKEFVHYENSNFNLKDDAYKHNVIIMVATDASLTVDKFPFDFISNVQR